MVEEQYVVLEDDEELRGEKEERGGRRGRGKEEVRGGENQSQDAWRQSLYRRRRSGRDGGGVDGRKFESA